IAHCNFGLRGDESDGDEKFVRDLAADLGVEIFIKRFETKAFSAENKLSTQLAARELRYNWFREITKEKGFKYIATAHHQNDFTETVLLNVVKGSILQGLLGIPLSNENIIRPLLFAEKADILDFAKENNWNFREDSSNKEDKYQRNLIRNQVIPLLKNINPNVTETVYQAAQNRKYITDFFLKESERFVAENVIVSGNKQTLSIYTLPEKYLNPAFFNFWLSPFGFNFKQSTDLVSCLSSTESKTFLSKTHKLVKERDNLVLSFLQTADIESNAYIDSPKNALVFRNKNFESAVISPDEIGDLKDKDTAYFDLEKVEFPLALRSWQQGDYFLPFGFGKRKKISDFYTDMKFSSTEKAEQILLQNGNGELMWIVGLRTDDRFKITDTTKQVLRIAVK
ncbi:MAG: tRNA lysidine(34) synthetase TilS, partial [Bacteroidia bacterium]